MSGPPVPFSSLPLSKTHSSTRLNAWGAYGPSDELGFLNRLTPSIIASAASSEIQTGDRVPLDAPMDFQTSHPAFQSSSAKTEQKPLFGRKPFSQDVIHKSPRTVHDDVWTFNTQVSTQWDGLRHFGYQSAKRFYNDTTVEDIAGTSEKGRTNPGVLGIQNVVKTGGIVGRGVLVDFARWATTAGAGREVVGDKFQNFETSPITLEHIQQTLAHQKTELKFGDILFVRSGFFPAFYGLSAADLSRMADMTPPHFGGVEQSDAVLEWIWNNFSAVASDHPSFEQWPTPYEWSLHEVLLAGWGCNIGELFQLEELSKKCDELGRWSFFVAGVPTHVNGGVASPPNMVAIF